MVVEHNHLVAYGMASGPRGASCGTRGLQGVIVSGGRGAARAEDAQGTPTQSHISPNILVYEEKQRRGLSLLSYHALGPH